MARIERTPRARIDLADIWVYIARDNVDAADALSSEFESRFTSLAQFPLSGEAAPMIKCWQLRRLLSTARGWSTSCSCASWST